MAEITDLCLAGGASRGVCYLGALKKLEEVGILKLKKIVGTSIGALIGLSYILGFSVEELFDIIVQKNTHEFFDFSLYEDGAIVKGEKLRSWIHDILQQKMEIDTTFEKLYEKTGVDFVTTGICIGGSGDFEEGLQIFSKETTPDMPLLTAIYATMAFPYIFPPVEYKSCKFIDGGLLSNFPMDLIDSEKGLGITTNSRSVKTDTIFESPGTYTNKLYQLISAHISKFQKLEDNNNIINIVCNDFDLINFKQTIDDKVTLYMRGYNDTQKYLRKTYDL